MKRMLLTITVLLSVGCVGVICGAEIQNSNGALDAQGQSVSGDNPSRSAETGPDEASTEAEIDRMIKEELDGTAPPRGGRKRVIDEETDHPDPLQSHAEHGSDLGALHDAEHGEHEGGHHDEPTYPKGTDGLDHDQYSIFPVPLATYEDPPKDEAAGLWANLKQTLKYRWDMSDLNKWTLICFLCAVFHALVLAPIFGRLEHYFAHRHYEHIHKNELAAQHKPYDEAEDHQSFLCHILEYLAEVEAVFLSWALVMFTGIWYILMRDNGMDPATAFDHVRRYITYDVNYREPVFIVFIMTLARTRPVIRLSQQVIGFTARRGGNTPAAWWLSILTIAPILGSFITEPAAMTIGATLLGMYVYVHKPGRAFKYATLGLLFVNVSVGGVLTNFAAPPVLMVANPWQWTGEFMLKTFGYKAVLGIVISNMLYFVVFRSEFKRLFRVADGADGNADGHVTWDMREDPIPFVITLIHLLSMGLVVKFNHDIPMMFLIFGLFYVFRDATKHHQNQLSLRMPILVGCFLTGLVMLGAPQGWWIQPVLTCGLPPLALMLGSGFLTGFNDNAAITYLASKADGVNAASKVAIMNGAVGGGGVSILANAPNPAGKNILQDYFDGGINALYLLLGAAVPTAILLALFHFLPAIP